MTLNKLLTSSLITISALTSCSTFNPENLAQEWDVVKVGNESVVPGPHTPYLGFDGKQIYGYTGCNRINGTFQIAGSEFKTENVSSTMKLCPDAKYEQQFLQALNQAELLEENATGCVLLDKNHKSLLSLSPRKMDTEKLEGKWVLSKMNGKEVTNDEMTPFIAFNMKENLFSGFTGCNRLNCQLNKKELKECKANFKNMAMTRKFCQNHKEEADFVEALNNASTINVVGNNLYIYNEEGNSDLVFSKEQ